MDNKQLDMSFSGLTPEEQQSHNSLYAELASLVESPSFLKSYSELPTPYERIKFVLSHEIVRLVVEQFAVRCNALANLQDETNVTQTARGKEFFEYDDKKSVTQAVQFGEKGTDAFKAHRYKEALVSYSDSIRYAPDDSDLLPIAFGNRSGAFFQLEQYEAALKDIEAAETHPKYKPFFMLTIRKCQCLVRLGHVAQAKKILHIIKRENLSKGEAALLAKFYKQEGENLKDVKEDDKKEEYKKYKNYFETELLKSLSSVIKILSENGRFDPQPNNSSLSSKVEVRYDEKNGRHLVTTQEVHFGVILAVTKPYASVLIEEQELLYCHHCLASLKLKDNIPRSVPCAHCARVLYCSEYCSAKSWHSYHRFECALDVHSFEKAFMESSSEHRLALRTLFVAGGLEAIRAVTQKFKSTDDAAKSADFNQMDSYENIYRMAMKDFDILERIKTIIRVAFVYKWFKSTEIDNPDSASPNDNIFAIETLERHFLQIFSNDAIFVRCDQSALNDQTVLVETIYTLDPLISLVRKSCDPNISIIVVDCARDAPHDHVSNVCVFFAIKPIAPGAVLSSVASCHGDSEMYRINVDEFVKLQHVFWNQSEPKHLCDCEYCECKRRDSPFGTTSTLDGHELVCCGANCGGFIRRTDGGKVNCTTCKRDIGSNELAELKNISKNISKKNSQAIALIARAKTSIVNYKQKENLPKGLTTVLQQLETLINDRIAPLALKHSRLLLVDLYKQLKIFYLYCNNMDEPNHFAHLQKAWKYANASHTTLETHFGGDSLTLLVLLQKNVQIFSRAIGLMGIELMDPVGPMVGGRYLEFHINLNDDTEDEYRNIRARMVKSFHRARKQLDRLNEYYKMI